MPGAIPQRLPLLLAFVTSITTAPAAVPAVAQSGNSPSGAASDDNRATHPLEPAIKRARASLKAIRRVKDYRALFTKRDIVDGRVYEHTMIMKFRDEPFSVYLRFLNPHRGREVIYVNGRNNGKLLAHGTGVSSLVGTVALDPDGEQALSESKYPITEIGMENMLERVIKQWEKEKKKYPDIEVRYFPKARHSKLGKKKEHLVIQSVHPRRRNKPTFHMTRLWIDKETNLPVRVSQWGFPRRRDGENPLLEAYTYANVRTNVGLKDIDFDVRNPNYGF